MTPGLSLIGSGMDSCVIDTRELVQPSSFYAVTISDTTLLRGFKIIVSDMYPINNYWGFGIKDPRNIKNAIIEFNYIAQAGAGIKMSRDSDSIIIRKNIVKETREGFNLSGIISANNYFIEENYIEAISLGTYVSFGGDPKTQIKNNIMIIKKDGEGIFRWNTALITIENNIVIKSETSNDWRFGINISRANGVIKNNVIMGKFRQGIVGLDYNEIINNVVMNSRYGIENGENNTPLIKYNNMWDNLINNYQGFTPDSTNMSVDPMFVDTSGWDFRLQKHSPMIDAGDPEILDVDGTRSDIGVYGGPYGVSYPYEDLAPGKPRGAELLHVKNKTFLRWRKNTESDITGYKIYNDTIPEFPISQQTYFASEGDTLIEITDLINSGIPRAYLKVTAVDSLGNESVGGEEVLWGDPLTVKLDGIIPQAYKLYQNYPNPFNPTTTIGFTLKNRGYVKLMIYDIKGEMIKVLTNEWKERGYHEEEFNYSGQKLTSLASGIYLYKLEIIDENMIPVFTDIKKMILIK